MLNSLLRAKQYIGCYGLLLPTFVLLSIFSVIPFAWAFSTSFFDYEIGGASNYVGFQNYVDYFSDPTFWPSFSNMLFLTAFALSVNLSFPLIIAKLIFSLSSERSRYLYRIVFLIPMLIPNVAIVMIWRGMIYSDWGLINEILRLLNLEEWTQGWLSNPRTVLWCIAFIGFPFANGINILIYYAGFSGIPLDVHEASYLDGAVGLRKFLLVDIPLVLSQIRLLLILTIIAGVQGFENIFILTRGGPGFRTMVPGLWMYFNAFSFQKMGYACSIGVILFLIILILTFINLKYFKSTEDLQET